MRRLSTTSMNAHAVPYRKTWRVAIIGSGNWGSTVAKLVAENTAEKPKLFEPEVRMWVMEEQVEGKKLTELINHQHENVKYLPGVKLPKNLVADPDVRRVADGADILIFNVPHQFLDSVASKLKGIDFSRGAGISCLKGINVNADGAELLTEVITEKLGLHCGVLSGANVASEVAREKWCETTVAYPLPHHYKVGDVDSYVLKNLFQRPYFHVQISDDVPGVSIGGALKNVVALGAGLVEGAGWGDNAKAAVMRIGLLEMIKFGVTFFPGTHPETFTYESAGVADLITTCYGGRNVKVARAFQQEKKPIEQIEKELLNGQSAQGVVTLKEVYELLVAREKLEEFPLINVIYDIIMNGAPVEELPKRVESR